MDNLQAILESTNLPCTYRQWKPKKPPALPYIVYLFTDADNFAADNIVYHGIGNYDVELYSNDKDPVSESAVESALTQAGVFYEKIEVYIQSEEMYQVVYSIQWDGVLFTPPEPEEPEPDPEEE